jgi:hypothetical protein
MNLFKKLVFLSFIVLSMTLNNTSFAQVRASSKTEVTTPKVEFTLEEIEKIKTLLEHHFKTRIGNAEMAIYGKATDQNLALYKMLDDTRKEDPFFSQPHITFIIESMEERLGNKRPQAKYQLGTPTKKLRNPKISKLPKNRNNNF